MAKRYHTSKLVQKKSHHEGSVKLINAFVDAMGPLDRASRRVHMKEADKNFPLRDILNILVARKHMELAKRVLEGYVWLSCQKVSNERYTPDPNGPEVLVRWDFPLVDMCDKIGWSLLGDVLVDSVSKLCEFKNTAKAFELMDKVTAKSSSCGEDSECSCVCVRMAKVASDKVLDRFQNDPTTTAKFFVTQYKNLRKDPSNNDFCGKLLNSFVDTMSPKDINNRKVPLR